MMIETPTEILTRRTHETNTSKVVRMIHESREQTEILREMRENHEVLQTEKKKKRVIRKKNEDDE